jgi:hypothetical protein
MKTRNISVEQKNTFSVLEPAVSDPDPFQVAALRAYSAHGDDAWNRFDHRERSFAICQELRRLDAEQIASWLEPAPARRSPPTGRPRRDRKQESRGLPVAVDRKTKSYRVVVRAKQLSSKGYHWEIDSDDTQTVIRQSTTGYGTMAQAYDCGAAALAAFSPGQRQ